MALLYEKYGAARLTLVAVTVMDGLRRQQQDARRPGGGGQLAR